MDFNQYFFYAFGRSLSLFCVVLAVVIGAGALAGAIYSTVKVIQSDLHLALKIIIPLLFVVVLVLIGVFLIPYLVAL